MFTKEEIEELAERACNSIKATINAAFADLSLKAADAENTTPIKSVEYIDLGLPSGTLWSDRAEVDEQGKIAFYDYFKAVEMFGNKLPKSWQLQELLEECTWTWVENGYEVKGKNGNRIFITTTGEIDGNGLYWSRIHKVYGSAALVLESRLIASDVRGMTPTPIVKNHMAPRLFITAITFDEDYFGGHRGASVLPGPFADGESAGNTLF